MLRVLLVMACATLGGALPTNYHRRVAKETLAEKLARTDATLERALAKIDELTMKFDEAPDHDVDRRLFLDAETDGKSSVARHWSELPATGLYKSLMAEKVVNKHWEHYVAKKKEAWILNKFAGLLNKFQDDVVIDTILEAIASRVNCVWDYRALSFEDDSGARIIVGDKTRAPSAEDVAAYRERALSPYRMTEDDLNAAEDIIVRLNSFGAGEKERILTKAFNMFNGEAEDIVTCEAGPGLIA